jgi:hypothetical protein
MRRCLNSSGSERIVFAAVLLALSGCVGDDRDARSGDPLNVRYAAVLLGAGDGGEWNRVQIDIQEAQEARKGECMRERGFDYRDRPAEWRITVGPPLLSTEPAYAKQFGFGLSEPIPSSASAADDPNSERYSALTGGSRTAWNVAEEECEMAAVDTTWESDGLAAVNSLIDEVNARVASSREVSVAQSEWKACVERAGYTFTGSSWDDLLAEYQARWERVDREDAGAVDTFRRAEIAVASAAADCAAPMWAAMNDVRRSAVEALEPTMAAAVFG